MTHLKSEKERMWKARKESQNPHGKVQSFKEISETTTDENAKRK